MLHQDLFSPQYGTSVLTPYLPGCSFHSSHLCHYAAQLCFHHGGLETLQVLSKPLSTNANKTHLPTLLRGLPNFPIPGSNALSSELYLPPSASCLGVSLN